MTQSAVKFRTLGELRKQLQTRIGGVAGISFSLSALDTYLQDAQKFWYDLVDWKHLYTTTEYPIVRGSVFYDLPEGVNLEKIKGIWIKEDGYWHQLREGITVQMRNFDNTAYLRHYEIGWNNTAADENWKLQIELFPAPKEDTQIRYEYIRGLLDFENVDDVASIPDDLILLHATLHAKLHYRQPDAPIYEKDLDRQVAFYRARHRKKAVIGEKRPIDLTYAYPPKWD